MIVLYLVILVVFGGLTALALVSYNVRRGALLEERKSTEERLARREESLRRMRDEMEELAVDLELLEFEKRSLEAQENCMKHLDRFEETSVADDEGA